MPVIERNDYHPAWPFTNGHFATIYPSLMRKPGAAHYKRQRIETDDGDFLDIDWKKNSNKKVVLICHGLEGSADAHYVVGMGNHFAANGWDVAAMNYRGCSGEVNRTLRFYHSGATDDLHRVIIELLTAGYDELFLVGFSLGGNLILKYLGEGRYPVDKTIRGAAVFSVPVNLMDSSNELIKKRNWVYTKRFLLKLRRKIKDKMVIMPEKIDVFHFLGIRNLIDFDDYYTAPLHGFADARDYYQKNSALQWLTKIKTPTLLVNALDDPFLGPQCYPLTAAKENDNLFLLTPEHGGHVGFYAGNHLYWSEEIALNFALNKKIVE